MALTTPRGGRPKGSTNKLSRDIKEMIKTALEEAGGEKYLLKQAHDNPNAFLSLVSKIIPAEAKVSANVTINPLAEVLSHAQGIALNVLAQQQQADDA